MSLTDLVDRYARRFYPDALAQQPGQLVCSPLGVWLILACVADGATGAVRERLEELLGCPARDASRLAGEFLAEPPDAIRAASACWVRPEERAGALIEWLDGLPDAVARGAVPSQLQADLWAFEHTDGLIDTFPLELSALTRIVLTSVLASKVSWVQPFEAIESGVLDEGSVWRQTVSRVLTGLHNGRMGLYDTPSAGLVAVHVARAAEGLEVFSVIGEPTVERGDVLVAAHDVAAALGHRDSVATPRSLWDVPGGSGHSWTLLERVAQAPAGVERLETFRRVTLPAWNARCEINLLAGDFGIDAAGEALIELAGTHPDGDEIAGMQVATATYDRTGFQAASISAMSTLAGAAAPTDRHQVREWVADLSFGHPYAVVATTVGDWERTGGPGAETGIPVFAAWVAQATDV